MAKHLYLFYRIRDNRDSDLYSTPLLYAWTIKKRDMKMFKDQRDMEVFLMKSKKIDKDDEKFRKFSLDNNQTMLTKRDMYTKSKINDQNKCIISVLCTWNELQRVYTHEDTIYAELSKYLTNSYEYLQDKLRISLNKIAYRDVRDFMLASKFGGYFESVNKDDQVDLDIDEFQMYMYFNGVTYK